MYKQAHSFIHSELVGFLQVLPLRYYVAVHYFGDLLEQEYLGLLLKGPARLVVEDVIDFGLVQLLDDIYVREELVVLPKLRPLEPIYYICLAGGELV